uniref:Reverse transcriptase domain-containing protein n=1 Tax=Tanacetum cinerariifolium TaxID=118510 RepID=A0A6L2MCP6_TANCI|nr:reverse transcriptase domain-containing protein [Tanacetum cinerariifolium]
MINPIKILREKKIQIAHVEVTNRDIVKGMERRLGKNHQGWVDELPHVVWAHMATLKSSKGETPFSLTYRSEAIVTIEISMETKRFKEFEVKLNEKWCIEDLDILEERREITSIREAHYKQKTERVTYVSINVLRRVIEDSKKAEGACCGSDVVAGVGEGGVGALDTSLSSSSSTSVSSVRGIVGEWWSGWKVGEKVGKWLAGKSGSGCYTSWVKFCAGEDGLKSWEWCGGGGVAWRVE